MAEVEKWAFGVIGAVIGIFSTLMGSHRFLQNQLNKYKEAIDAKLAKHEEDVQFSIDEKVDKATFNTDMKHMAKTIESLNETVKDGHKAIFDELKSVNDKLFSVVRNGTKK